MELQHILEQCQQPYLMNTMHHVVHHVMSHTRTQQEMRLTIQIRAFEMDKFILDLGSKVNVLTLQTWEQMGSPKLTRSLIHLRLENQQRVSPLGRQ